MPGYGRIAPLPGQCVSPYTPHMQTTPSTTLDRRPAPLCLDHKLALVDTAPESCPVCLDLATMRRRADIIRGMAAVVRP